MAFVTHRSRGLAADLRGVVYVEFVFAFFPVFLLFLAVCQIALVASAQIVVRHAALAGARSAIVVLEEPPEDFGGAPRGSVTEGEMDDTAGVEAFLSAIGMSSSPGLGSGVRSLVSLASTFTAGGQEADGGAQRGARMVPVRTAAYVPLLALAPGRDAVSSSEESSLGESVVTGLEGDVHFALDFTRAATVVTVHEGSSEEPASARIGHKSLVTVRVSYAFPCGVPLVRRLLCHSAERLTGANQSSEHPFAERLRHAESPGALRSLVTSEAYFMPLSASVTLPNQGAGYYLEGGGS